MSKLTQAQLKEVLRYDPKTGKFTWIKAGHRRAVGKVAGWKNARNYIAICLGGKTYFAHRLAWLYMTGKHPTAQIDHINHIRDDNRWANLRSATNEQNHQNSPLTKANKSGVPGVRQRPSGNWHVTIGVGGKSIVLGTFTDFDKAVKARRDAEEKYGFHPNHGNPTNQQSEE